jgi:hypothetical protein
MDVELSQLPSGNNILSRCSGKYFGAKKDEVSEQLGIFHSEKPCRLPSIVRVVKSKSQLGCTFREGGETRIAYVTCAICCSNDGNYDEYCLLGCDTV